MAALNPLDRSLEATDPTSAPGADDHRLSLVTLLQTAGIAELARGSFSTSFDREIGDHPIRRITTDSRHIQTGDLFVGLPGTRLDGGSFWAQALEQGAVAAVISTDAAQATGMVSPPDRVVMLPTEVIPKACGQLAAALYGFPSQHLDLVGVTGTNGKTTTTHLIEYLLTAAGRRTALLGTLYNRWPGSSAVAEHTTLFAPALQQTLAEAQTAGCTHAVMEVSSHALAQDRVWGCQFAAAVWTNLTQDHLDFHPTMEAYWQAKARLFDLSYLQGQGRAIVNQDDPGGQQLLQAWSRLRPGSETLSPWTYSLQGSDVAEARSDLWPEAVAWDAGQLRTQIHTPIGSMSVVAPLAGSFNLANLLAAIGAVVHLGVDREAIESALPQFPGVPGRMEMVTVSDLSLQPSSEGLTVIVDYAHTPDGLENLLKAVRPLVQGRLICVFGCGGDRDRTKRPKMGKIAADWSDWVVVTSDNPRTEDPHQILEDILAGFDPTTVSTLVEVDRRTAIQTAIAEAHPHDTVVIAGKGHEDYQILGTTKIHFDDREVAREALQERYSRSGS